VTDLTSIPAASVCGEAGRQMFFEYVGRYFAIWPTFKKSPPGTACPICGNTTTQLYDNSSKIPTCLVQATITRKRATRESPDKPLIPVIGDDGKGKTAFADGHYVVAGPHGSTLVTSIRPNAPLPANIEVKSTGTGSISAAKRSLLTDPPPPPFVTIVFSKKANYPVDITVHPSQIIMNGKDAATVDIERVKELADSLGPISIKELEEILKLRDRLSGTTRYKSSRERDKDQIRYSALRDSNQLPPALLRRLPKYNSDAQKALYILLSPISTTDDKTETETEKD
jgi:hypothetical protein